MKTILYSILALIAVVLAFSFLFPSKIDQAPRTANQVTSKQAFQATKNVMHDYLQNEGIVKYSLSQNHTAVDMGTAHWLINSSVSYMSNGQKQSDKYHIELKWNESEQEWDILKVGFTPSS